MTALVSNAIRSEVIALANDPRIAALSDLAKDNALDMKDKFQAMQILNYNWMMNGYEPASKIGSIYEAVLAYRHAAFLASFLAQA